MLLPNLVHKQGRQILGVLDYVPFVSDQLFDIRVLGTKGSGHQICCHFILGVGALPL